MQGKSSRTSQKLASAALAALSAAALTANAFGSADTWTGAGTDSLWSDGTNWSNDTLQQVPPAGGNNVHFAGTANLNPTNDSITSVSSIVFDPNAGPFVLGGNTIALGAASVPSLVNDSPVLQTIDMSVNPTSARTIDADQGPIALYGTLVANSRVIFESVALSGVTETPVGGTTTLYSPADYFTTSGSTAATQIWSGVLQIGTGGSLPTLALGGTSQTESVALGTANFGGVLELGDSTGPVAQTIDLLVLNANAVANSCRVVGGASAISTLTIDNTTTPSSGNPSSSTSFAGLLGGPGTNQNNLALNVNMLAANGATLLNSETYVGNTSVTGGTLAIGSANSAGSIVSPNVNIGAAGILLVAQLGSISPSTNLTSNGAVYLRNPGTALATLNGAGSINLSTATQPTMLTITGGGSFSGPITEAGPGSNIVAAGGTLTLSGSVLITGGLTVSAGATLAVGTSSTSVASLSIAGGTLDIGKGSVQISYGSGADPVSTINGYIAAAYDTGAWDKPGLTSSAIGAHPHTAVGISDDTTNHIILAKFTEVGDANLDGTVNSLDFNALAGAFNSSNIWSAGDFNHDGVVNASDFALLAANYGATLPASGAALGALVPEPANCASLALIASLAAFSPRGHAGRRQRRVVAPAQH